MLIRSPCKAQHTLLFFPGTQLSEYMGNSITTNNSPNEKLCRLQFFQFFRRLIEYGPTTSTAPHEDYQRGRLSPFQHTSTQSQSHFKIWDTLERFCHPRGKSSGQTQENSQKKSHQLQWGEMRYLGKQ